MAIVYATPTEVAAYMGIPVGDLQADILTIIERAQDLIDYATLNKINDYYLNSTKTAIDDTEIELAAQKATAAQVEYWLSLGGSDTDVINAGNIASFAIGNFSMAFGAAGSGSANASMAVLAPRASRILFLVGLLYRGIWRSRPSI